MDVFLEMITLRFCYLMMMNVSFGIIIFCYLMMMDVSFGMIILFYFQQKIEFSMFITYLFGYVFDVYVLNLLF